MEQSRVYTVTMNPAWDRTVQVARLQPGGTNLAGAAQGDAGGKGVNVSRVLRAFGVDTVALGLLGGGVGSQLLAQLEAEGVAQNFVRLAADCRTNTKIVDLSAGVTTEVNEPGPPVGPGALAELEAQLKVLPRGGVVVLAGSLPGQVGPGWYAQAAAFCHRAGQRVILDASREALRQGMAGEPELLKPNREELTQLCGTDIDSPQKAAKAAQELLGGHTVLAAVSLGAQGAVFVAPGCAVWAKAPRVEPVSTVGAGDTMTAVLAAWLARRPQGQPAPTPDSAAKLAAWAVAAATAKVLRPGTRPPALERIRGLQPQVQLQRLPLC